MRARTWAPAAPAAATLRAVGHVVSRYWGVLGLLALWQLWVSVSGYNQIVVPPPQAVLTDLVTHPGEYARHTWSTIWVASVGLVAGMALGTLGAMAAWFTPLFAGMVTPTALVMRSVPIVAMVPVIARLLGYGTTTIVAIAIVISFFPAFVFTTSGLNDTPPGTADLFTVMGTSRRRRMTRLAVPSAVPNLLVALRLSAANCVLAALIAEFLMGTDGLGYVFARTRAEMNMARSWGAALVATALSVGAFLVAARIERSGRQRWL